MKAEHGDTKALPRIERGGRGQRGGVRLVLSSTRFIASLFWLTIVVATLVFVLPYSDRAGSPVFYAFVGLGVATFLAHRYFPYEGYHPMLFFLLMLMTDALVALMVYITGGFMSNLSLLFLAVIIFSSAYFELLETLLIAAVTCAFYFAPLLYESLPLESLKSMAVAVPIYLIIALCGFFVISKAREQEREKQDLTLLFDQADSKRRELSTLYAVSLKLASTLDEDEILFILRDSVHELVEHDAFAIALMAPSGGLRVRIQSGLSEEEVAILEEEGEGNPLYVSASAVLPVILRKSEADARFAAFIEGMGRKSMIAVPLYASSSVIGVLVCLSESDGAFDDDAARILLTLASESALALEKAKLYRTTLDDKTKIEAIINSLTDGLLVIDREAKLVLANPFISRIMGLGEEDRGEELAALLRRSGRAFEFKELSVPETLDRVLGKGESMRGEMAMNTDPAIIFQAFWVPLQDAVGRVTGAVILLHDITDFVELDRMKSDFISIVSHELKTPLTSIKGFARLLAAERVGPINDKQRHYLDIVQSQAESLTDLINDLLDLSKIEAGIIEVRQEAVDLAEVIAGVVQQLGNMAAEKEISVQVEVPDGLPPVSGDPGRLAQVFMNLIHNAIKFTSPGGSVRVKAGKMGDACMVKVADSGIGISQQDLPKVFDKFYQVDSSSTRQQSGTGLGLSITRRLVLAHGGEIWVNSVKGKGTTFSLTLPFHDADGKETRDRGGLDAAATGPGRKGR